MFGATAFCASAGSATAIAAADAISSLLLRTGVAAHIDIDGVCRDFMSAAREEEQRSDDDEKQDNQQNRASGHRVSVFWWHQGKEMAFARPCHPLYSPGPCKTFADA